MNTVENADKIVDNSLDVIQPLGDKVTITHNEKDYTINITEFMFGDIGRVVAAVTQIGISFSSIDRDNVGIAVNAIVQNIESAYEIIILAIRDELIRLGFVDEEAQIKFVKNLSGMNGVRLVTKIVKVNYDFFYQAREIAEAEFPQLKQMSGEQNSETETDEIIENETLS